VLFYHGLTTQGRAPPTFD